MSESKSLSIATKIAYVIADELGEEPAELSPTIDEVINVDALEELFADQGNGEPRGSGLVTFEYEGMYVHVDDEGFVTIEGRSRGSFARRKLLAD